MWKTVHPAAQRLPDHRHRRRISKIAEHHRCIGANLGVVADDHRRQRREVRCLGAPFEAVDRGGVNRLGFVV